MAYKKINWENTPSIKTPINAENLKHMEDGIYKAHQEIEKLPEWSKEDEKPSYTPEDIGSYSKEEIDVLKANSILTTHKGELIQTTDSAKAKPKNIKLFGKTEQPSTEGNQLFDVSKFPTTTIGNVTITNNGDGSLTISGEGNPTQGVNISYRLTHEETVKMIKAGKLYFNAGAITYPYFQISLKHANGSYFGVYNFSQSYSNITITEEMINDETCYLDFMLYGSTAQSIVPATIKPMLYQDGNGIWEPYTGGEASPNMNYSQPLNYHGESGSIMGKIGGENLIDVNGIVCRMYGEVLEDGTKITINGDDLIIKILKRGNNIIIPLLKKATKGNQYMNYTISDGVSGRQWCSMMGTTMYGGTSNPGEGGGVFDLPPQYYIDRMQIGCGDVYFEAGTIITLTRSYINETGNGFTPYIVPQPFTALTPNGLAGIPLGTTIPDVIANSPVHMSGVYWNEAEKRYYIGDTVEYESGEYVQRILRFKPSKTMVFQSYDESTHRAFMYRTDIFEIDRCLNGLVPSFSTIAKWSSWANGDNKTFAITNQAIYYKDIDKGLEEINALFAELGTDIEFEAVLESPITTDLTEEEMAQYNALVLNKGNNNLLNDAGAYMEVEYVADTKKHIEQNYVSKEAHQEHENRIAELEKAIVNS